MEILNENMTIFDLGHNNYRVCEIIIIIILSF
jgi:hypothetical protein